MNFLALSRQDGKKRTGAFIAEDMHGSGFAPAPLSSSTRPCLSGGIGSVVNLPGVRKAVPAGASLSSSISEEPDRPGNRFGGAFFLFV